MGRLKNAVLFSVKGLSVKLLERNSVSLAGLGRISPKAELITRNNGVIEMGKYVYVFDYASLSCDGGKMTIEEHVGINRSVILRCHGRIKIGSGTLLGPNVCVFDHNRKFGLDGLHDDYSVGSVEIGKNCWLGANVTVLKNTRIGDGCVIGAGCVVSGEIPAHSIVTGNRELTIRPIEQR